MPQRHFRSHLKASYRVLPWSTHLMKLSWFHLFSIISSHTRFNFISSGLYSDIWKEKKQTRNKGTDWSRKGGMEKLKTTSLNKEENLILILAFLDLQKISPGYHSLRNHNLYSWTLYAHFKNCKVKRTLKFEEKQSKREGLNSLSCLIFNRPCPLFSITISLIHPTVFAEKIQMLNQGRQSCFL